MNFDTGDHCGSSQGNSDNYEPSIASTGSTVSSSQASVFSDTLSAQSSIATSISDDFRGTQEDAREHDRICAAAQLRFQAQNKCLPEQSSVFNSMNKTGAHCLSYADVTSVPAVHKQHPRRSSSSRDQKAPPQLVRQCDRKTNFVDNLVDSATQMVEVIWPLSVVPCRGEGSGRGVLPLRIYIQETLRRSRTSYSTLQVALYYLVLIRPHVPKSDFTMEQIIDCPADRSLMCGRRMFLAALILASKYLQDRNYSAKAWSKMSGLRVCEINMNERTFLSKINWKLHIPQSTFEKWQELVLRYSPNPPSPGLGPMVNTSTWKQLVPVLTPDLEGFSSKESRVRNNSLQADSCGFPSSSTPTPTQSIRPIALETNSHENTPTPATVLPRFLEPKPDIQPPTPALARMGPLPTPNMTPSSVASNTPAASAYGSRRPSICSAMATAHRNQINRCATDLYPTNFDYRTLSRRPSISATSSGSSPESLMTDNSRSSRASSISSISTASTTSSMAPQRACLARQATCRNVRLPHLKLVREEKEGTANRPILIDDDVEMVSSPVAADFSISEKAMHAPHRHSRADKPATITANCVSEKRKRGRTHGHRRSELQEEVRYLLDEVYEDEMDVDDDITASPEAAYHASSMLAHRYSPSLRKQVQHPTMHARRESNRVVVQKNDGRKRFCGSARALSVSPIPLYGEVA